MEDDGAESGPSAGAVGGVVDVEGGKRRTSPLKGGLSRGGVRDGVGDHKRHKRKGGIAAEPLISRREALHLIIYAPKRGVVELWPVRQGARTSIVSGCSNGR